MRRFAVQAIAVFLSVGLLTYLSDHFGYRSGFNALWMFGLPIAVAVFANRDGASRCLAGLVLFVLGPIASIVTAAVFGLGM
ncbi:hypothetical protein [Sphingomonas oryzagri]